MKLRIIKEIETGELLYKIIQKDGSEVILKQHEWDYAITKIRLKADKQHYDNIYLKFTTWRQKIKEGYFYKINPDYEPLTCITGHGGAILAGELFEKEGFSDSIIQSLILITESEGITTNMKFHPLTNVIWREKAPSQER